MAKAATIFAFMIFSIFVYNGSVSGASTVRGVVKDADEPETSSQNEEPSAYQEADENRNAGEIQQPEEIHQPQETQQPDENQQPDVEDLPPGRTLPNTGYWNYLLIFGLRGRFLHYLLTNTNGFGTEIKQLDSTFKSVFGEDKFENLEKEVAESFDVSKALFHLGELIRKIKDIRDPVTKKTLGDAFRIIHNLSSDRTIVQEFVRRLHMVDNLAAIFKNPDDPQSQWREVKDAFRQNPDLFSKLLSDPTIVSNIFESVLRNLTSDHLAAGADAIKRMVHLLIRLYPNTFERTWKEVLRIRDPQSGATFGDNVNSLRNIIKTPEFKSKIGSLLKHEHLGKITRSQNRVVPFLMKHGGIADKSGPSETLKTLIDELTPETCREHLDDFGVTVSLKEADEILRHARDGTLFQEFNERIAKAENMEGGLIPKNIVAVFEKDGIGISPERVVQVMELITMLPTDLLTIQLNMSGIRVANEIIAELQRKAEKATRLPETKALARELGINLTDEEGEPEVEAPQTMHTQTEHVKADSSPDQPTRSDLEEMPEQQIQGGKVEGEFAE